MPSTDLRPRTKLEILDGALALVKREFRVLVTLAAITYAPMLAIHLWSLGVEPGSESALDLLISTLGASLAAAPLIAVLTYAAGDAYWNGSAAIGPSLRAALPRAGAAVLASLVVTVVIYGGLILLLVPGIFFFVRYALVFPALILERRDARSALHRSWELSRGAGRTILAVVGLPFALYVTLYLLLLALFEELLGSMHRATALLIVYEIATAPIFAAIAVVLYYDRRVRVEALDLERMIPGSDGQNSVIA